MEQLDINIVIYLLGLAVVWGSIQQRVKTLEKKMDKHNGLIEKVYKLEKDQAVVEESVKVANHRIEDLERSI